MPEFHDDIAEFESMERAELVEIWSSTYGSAPFKGARKPSLVRGLAYHIQCKKLGGLNRTTQQQLKKIARGGQLLTPTSKSMSPKIKLGAQLVREWNGKTHTVHVTDQGFVLSGVTYGSLSAAAKAITGAHWSGPRFFGVSG